jgi:hypothetical protein
MCAITGLASVLAVGLVLIAAPKPLIAVEAAHAM